MIVINLILFFYDNLGTGEEQVRWATKTWVGEATGVGGAREDKATEEDRAYSKSTAHAILWPALHPEKVIIIFLYRYFILYTVTKFLDILFWPALLETL